MKHYTKAAAITAAASITFYPLTNYLAALERGYQAAGGEELLLAVGLWAALGFAVAGWQKKASGTAAQVEDFTPDKPAA